MHRLKADAHQPQDLLPSNAIVHAQIDSPLSLVLEAENLAKNTLPDRLAPPPIQQLLQAEHPLLAFLGMQVMGGPFDPAAFAEQTGVDLNSKPTLTVYPGDPSKFFILSLGLSNEEACQALLTAEEGPLKGQIVSIGGHNMIRAHLGNGPLRKSYGLITDGRLFVSGEPSLLLLLKEEDGYTRLSKDPYMSNVLEKTKDLDVFVSVYPGLVKPFVSQVGFFKYLPVSLLSQQKQHLLDQISDKEKEMIDTQLRMQLPVSGLEELLDYGECAVTAVYQSAFDSLFSTANSFDGVTFGLRTKAATPGMTVMIHAGEEGEVQGTAPIPMDELKSSLAAFPGGIGQWTAEGKSPALEPSVWITKTLNTMHQLMEAKGLRTEWLNKIQQAHINQQLLQPMESKSDWTLKINAQVKDTPQPNDYDSVQTFFTEWVEEQYQPAIRQVTVVPNHGPHLLSEYLVQQKYVLEQGQEQMQELVKTMQGQHHSWIDQLYRVDAKQRGQGVSEFTWENIWKTRSGLFGFNEHELIHRKVYLAREVDGYLVFHQDSGDHGWIEDFEWHTDAKLPASTATLLDLVPEGSHSISFVKLNEMLPTAVHSLAEMESLLHRDIQSYLADISARLQDAGEANREELTKLVSAVPVSPMLAAVNRNPETGEVYGLLPGNIAFPRPKLVPLLVDLIQDYEEQASDQGGFMTYAKHHDNTCEYGVLHHTGGWTSFIQLVGNAVAEKYLAHPEGMQILMSKAMTQQDMNPEKTKEILLKNPNWLFLENIQMGPRQQQHREKVQAQPVHSIPERDPATPQACIPLDHYYNASLADDFHKAGMNGNNLSTFPAGTLELDGVSFDARGLIHVTGRQLEAVSAIDYPASVENIIIGQKASKIHLLHGTGWPAKDGQAVAQWVLHFNDGSEASMPVRYGHEVIDWWTGPDTEELKGSSTAWEGNNPATQDSPMRIRLYKTTWTNPQPDKTISAMEIRSTRSPSAPFVLAITAEGESPSVDEVSQAF